MKNILVIFLVLLVTTSIYGEFSTAGRTGMQFLNLNLGARGSALAGTVISDIKGAESIYYNPAGIAYLENNEFLFSYTKWIAEINLFQLEYCTPKFQKYLFDGNVGFGLIVVDEGEISSIGIENTDGYSVKSSAIGLNLSYGKTISKFNIGGNLKFINRTLFNENNFAMLFDLGTIISFTSLKGGLNLGGVIKNIGFVTAAIKETDLPPLKFSAGVDYKYYLKSNNYFDTLLNIDIFIDNSPILNLGFEYGLNNKLFFRTGYSLATSGNRIEKYYGVSAGIGIISKKLKIDLGFIPVGELGNSVQLSVGLKF